MIRHFSLFSGIESFKKALTNLGIDNELVGYSEFDKYASVALAAIHGVSEDLNYGDITKIDEKKVPDCDLITYGFPCQDISVAGLGKGIIEGETRSGLLFDALRIIKYKKPKYAIAENVKNLVGKKFKDDFNSLLEELDSYGYNNYWQVLNAKDYGIPQNRERVFVVSIRKDVDTGYEFPKGFDNGLRLKDLLEDEVEDKYYIDNDRTSILLNNLKEQDLIVSETTIVASRGRNPDNPSDRTVGSPTEQRLEPNSQGITNTLTTVQKDNLVLEPSILRYERTEYGKRIRKQYENGKIQEKISNMREPQPRTDGVSNTLTTIQKDNLLLEPKRLGGLYDKEGKRRQAGAVWEKENIAPTIDTCQGGHREPLIIESYRIRKLTPKECWRLMGFTDEDYHKARAALEDRFYNGKDRSNSQMYKMAGNSIVVDVLEGILKNLI